MIIIVKLYLSGTIIYNLLSFKSFIQNHLTQTFGTI